MVSYTDYQLIVNKDEIGDFGGLISYSILNEKSDVSDIAYYGASSNESLNWASIYITTVENAINEILAGDPSNYYSVTFTDVTNISFNNTDTDNNGTYDPGEPVGEIIFGQVNSSYPNINASSSARYLGEKFAQSQGEPELQGDIWINAQHQSSTFGSSVNIWDAQDPSQLGTVGYENLLHEIGHSIGLEHPWIVDINGNKIGSTVLDNDKFSIMSFETLPGMVDPNDINNSVMPSGLQLFDIAALQSELLYGRNYTTRNIDDVYQLGSKQSFGETKADPFIYTIWDGGGIDRINAAGYDDFVKIDLRQGAFSSIGKAALSTFVSDRDGDGTNEVGLAKDNVAIAFHTVIENATGTSHDDILIGNEWGNILEGGGGKDTFYGTGSAYDGDKGFVSPDKNDKNDPNHFVPKKAKDKYVGGGGDDTVSYANLDKSIDLHGNGDYAGYIQKVDGGTDEYTEVENIIATSLNDSFDLNDSFLQADLFGLAGNDTFQLYAPNTQSYFIDGGSDFDTVYLVNVLEEDFTISGTSNNLTYAGINGLSSTINLVNIEKVIFVEPAIPFAGTMTVETIDGDNRTPLDEPMVWDAYVDPSLFSANRDASFTDFTASSSSSSAVSSAYAESSLSTGAITIGANISYPISDRAGAAAMMSDRITLTNPNANPNEITEFTFRVSYDIGGDWGLNQWGDPQVSPIAFNFGLSSIEAGFAGELEEQDTNTGNFFVATRDADQITNSLVLLGGGVAGESSFQDFTFRFTGETITFDIYFGAKLTTDPGFFFGGPASHNGYTLFQTDLIMPNGIEMSSESGVFLSDPNTPKPTLNGDALANNLTGTALDENISGGAGDDTLDGGAGNDIFDGGLGNDLLIGGSESSSYIYRTSDGIDVISDTGGDDTLVLTGGLSLADISFAQVGDDLILTIVDTITISNQYDADAATVVEWISFDDGLTIQLPNPFMQTNQPPIAVDDIYNLDANTVFFGNVISNDSDPDGDVLSVVPQIFTTDNDGLVVLNSDGSFTYTPATSFTGSDSFSYLLTDGSIETDTGLVTLNIQDTINHPVANEDAFIAEKDTQLSGNVLTNDTDPDGNTLSVQTGAFTTSEGGQVIFFSNGDFTYSPTLGFSGFDSFSYTLLDGTGGTDIGSVSVAVTSTSFTDGNDTITGGTGDDILYGGDGQDVHRGREGDDYFYASSGRDSYFGMRTFSDDNGIDTIDYSFAPSGVVVSLGMGSTSGGAPVDGFGYDDFAIANIENLVGTSFDDELHGSSASNLITGGAGDDFLAGYRQNDTLDGGEGSDHYFINFNDGQDVILDSSGDNDTIVFSASFIQSHIVLTDVNTHDVLITFTNSPGQSVLLTGQRDMSASTQIETLLFADGSEIGLLGQIGTLADDTLTGTASDDTLSGIDGADTLIGGDGDDTLNGGRGNDTLEGGNGNDILRGDNNDDVLNAGNQDDVLLGGAGHDELYGGMGNDVLDGGFQNDLLDGGSEDDVLFGDRGTDTLLGGEGNDILEGGLNNDTLDGGLGDDQFIYNLGDGVDTLFDGGGVDTLILGDGFNLGNTRFVQSGDDVIVSFLTNPGGTITLTDQRELSGTFQIESVLFSNGYTLDIATAPIIGTADADTIIGTAGTDFIEGRDGNDVINGGDGHDIITGEGGNDALDAGLGSDIYIFRGGDGHDTISDAGGLDDSIILGPTIEQRDVDFDFTGNDLILTFSDASSDSLTITNQTGSGAIESIVFDSGEAFSTVSITGTNVAETINGTDAGEFIFGLDGNDIINGNGGGDIIDGGAGDDTLNGGAGDDDFIHSAGHDILNGGEGIDRILVADGLTRDDVTILRYFETPDNLEIMFSDGSAITIVDQFIGPREGDGHIELMEFSDGTSISLNDGSEYLIIGTENRDVVSTSTILDREQGYVVDPLEGNDFLFGGRGDDYFYGSLGNDTFIGGLDGSDTVDYSFALTGIVANFGQTSGAGSVTTDGFGGTDTVNGMENVIGSSYDDVIDGNLFDNYIEGGAGNDTIDGYAGNDTIFGNEGDDEINGGDGNDHLVGGEGNDIVDGGAGDDIVDGGLGNDILIGGAGNDTLSSYEGNDVFYGGEGDDTYIYNLGGGNDTIVDGDGNDVIILGAGIDFDDFEFDKVGDDLVIDLDGTGTTFLTVEGHFTAGSEDIVETIITDDGIEHDITDPPVNDPPIGYDDVFTVDEDGLLSANVLLNDTDPDGDLLTVTSQSFMTSNGGHVELLANGDLTYTPLENFFGQESFIYVLSDGELEDVATVTITVNPVNDAPVSANDSFTVNEDTILSGNVLSDNGNGADSDIEGDTLSVISALITTAAGATVILNSDGSFTYTPALNVNGPDSFTYTLTDGDLTDTGTVYIDVLPVNDNPVAQDDEFIGEVHQSITGNVLSDNGNGPDSDIDGDSLFIIAETIETDHGSLELYTNGDFLYTPDTFFYGTESAQYTLLDGQGGSDTGLVSFTVELPPDTFFGTDAGDNIKYSNASETIHGLEGDDRLYGRGGDDLIFGGDGDDRLHGNAGDDLITGEHGNDIIRGGGGHDLIEGSDGDDKLFGGSGDDILSGGAGYDFLNGGSGADTFIFKAEDTAETDTIRGFDQDQGDTLDLSSVLEAFDPLNDAIEDFLSVSFNEASGKTTVSVDQDGGGDDFTDLVAIVAGNMSADEQLLLNSGSIII